MSIRIRRRASARPSQNGYALLVVLFLTTLLFLGSIAAAPYVRTQGQREKEQEMIWRGKQYVRGIKLYYRKMGRFPTSMDDLTKPKAGNIRFMRQAYKDPMNKSDGTWRFIYVGPAGQLIGSLKPPQQAFQMPGAGVAAPGTPAGANAQQAPSFGASGFGPSPAPQGGAQQGQGQQGQQAAGANPGQTGTQPNAQAAEDAATATPSGLLSDSPVLGGNIIGVGSKINKRSVIVYDKAKNYRLFEFVWNPSKDMANALNQQLGNQQNQKGIGPGQNQSLQPTTQPGSQPANNPTAPTTDMPLPTPPPEPPTPPPD